LAIAINKEILFPSKIEQKSCCQKSKFHFYVYIKAPTIIFQLNQLFINKELRQQIKQQ